MGSKKKEKQNQVTRKSITQKAIWLFSEAFQVHDNKMIDYQVTLSLQVLSFIQYNYNGRKAHYFNDHLNLTKKLVDLLFINDKQNEWYPFETETKNEMIDNIKYGYTTKLSLGQTYPLWSRGGNRAVGEDGINLSVETKSR